MPFDSTTWQEKQTETRETTPDERCLILAEFLETKAFDRVATDLPCLSPGDTFCMALYRNEHDCGTVACGIGWAATIPAIAAMGLTPKWLEAQRDTMASKVKEVFGISDWSRMFGAGRTCGPHELAADLRRWVSERELPDDN